ncbi:MFS transporter [Halobellus sp. EA9]|uniref:MFS transporter n=1 Tax=Halobellus sp. EA9 TaxID=3421647 RepID=UPI003EBCCF5B
MIGDTDERVIALGLARMADALGNSFLIIVLPLYIASGQVSIDALVGGNLLGFVVGEEFLIGFVLSLFGFLNSFGQPFTGRLSDRTGRRKAFVLFGLVLFAIGSVAYPFLSNYWAVLLARGFQGVGAAFSVPATVALVNDYARSDRERGGNFGVFNTFRLIGFGFGPIVAGLVIRFGPYATPFGALSGFNAAFGIAVLGAIVSFLLVAAVVDDPPSVDAEAGDDLSIRILDRGGPRLLDSVFVLGVGTFFMAATIALFAPLEAPIRARLGEGTFLFSVQFAAVVIANVLLQIPIGNASDAYGRRPFLLAGFVLLVPSVFAQGVVTTPLTMLGARLLQGVAVALVFAPSLALAGDLAGEGQSGSTLSVLTMAFGLGVAVGPLASGFLYNLGGFATPFTVGAVAALAALVLVYSQVRESLSDEPGGGAGPAAAVAEE